MNTVNELEATCHELQDERDTLWTQNGELRTQVKRLKRLLDHVYETYMVPSTGTSIDDDRAVREAIMEGGHPDE